MNDRGPIEAMAMTAFGQMVRGAQVDDRVIDLLPLLRFETARREYIEVTHPIYRPHK